MLANAARPEIALGAEVRLRCKDMAGVAEFAFVDVFDNNNNLVATIYIPVVFRRRCKNQQCCPRRRGYMAVHRWVLYGELEDEDGNKRGVGEYVTQYVPDTDVREILT